MTDHHLNALPKAYRLEEYELVRVLGSGGFGITYLGYDHNLDKAVAIKEYLPVDIAGRTGDRSVVPQTEEFRDDFNWGLERFLDEARTLARFTHPNIIQVYRFFEAHGTAYIVMEYAEGETLADLLKRRGTLTEDELKTILLPLLAGLEDVHQAGILHRDIKPGNIMLRALDGSPVLVDFGAARQAVGARSRSMTAIVTPGYAPIEQYSTRGHQGSWTDVYALGGVCYRALTGELPAEATDRVRSDPLIPIMEAGRGKAGDEFLQAIDWALRVDEGERPQGVGEWRAALLGEGEVPAPASALSSRSEVPVSKVPAASPAGRSGLFRWALALVFVLLVGAGGWWGWQKYGERAGSFVAMVKSVLPALEEVPPGTSAEVETEPPGEAGTETPGKTEAPGETGAETQVAGAGETPLSDSVESEPSASMEEESEPEPDTPTSEVDRLLAAAEADLAARRLTSPVGNNAWERYQRVLTLAPAHPEAMAGMERVLGSYLELFGAAVAQEDFDRAAGYLERIRGLHPDSPALAEGEQRLASAKQTQADRLAENQAIREHLASFEAALRQQDFDGAAGYLARIRALRLDAPGLLAGEQRLAEARQAAELERQRQAEAEASRQAELFEEALRQGDFDGAASHLERVRELHPQAPVLAEGEQRLAEARQAAELERQRRVEEAARQAELFEEALRQGDLDGAASHLERVRELHPASPVLVEAQQRLAEARQAAELERQRLESEARVRKAVGEMVSIPGGTFRMGDLSGEGIDSEKPVHTVTIEPFELGKFEVTFAQWDACVDDGGCGGYRPDDEGWGRGNRPVINVSWDDTRTFINWLNDRTGGHYRLPTEAEWEYAARAGSTTKYHFGDDESLLCRYANHADTSTDYDWRNTTCSDGVGKRTAEVGRYQSNAFGLHDMHGNVWEWVADCWNDSYRGAPSDGSAWTSSECGRRVLRGGSWFNVPRFVRSANRGRDGSTVRDSRTGFRLVRVVQD